MALRKVIILTKSVFTRDQNHYYYNILFGKWSNQFAKSHRHMWRRWDTPQNFCLAFINELEKQLFIKKLLKWANKKCNNFNIYNVVFLQKKKWRKTPADIIILPPVPKFLNMIYNSWDIECDRLKLVIVDHFLPFYPTPKNCKNKNCEKIKNMAGDIIISQHVCQKPQSYEVKLMGYGVRQTKFVYHIFGHDN